MTIKKLANLAEKKFLETVNGQLSLAELRELSKSAEFYQLPETRREVILREIAMADGVPTEEEVWEFLEGLETRATVLSIPPNKTYRRVKVRVETKAAVYELCGVVQIGLRYGNSYKVGTKIPVRFTKTYGEYESAI